MSRALTQNWLRSYLIYTYDLLSPEMFNLWTAISVIGSALQRRVFIPVQDGYLCFPNDFVVLIGPPGTMKSTAMRTGRKLITPIKHIKFATESTTREKLIVNFAGALHDGHSSMSVHSPELASFFSSSKMDMVVFLTDIYDSPETWAHDTKLSGINVIQAPCLNLLAATTPDSFSKEVPAETSGIGLTSRMIFVYASKPRVRPWRAPPDPNKVVLKDMLHQDLIRISTLKGEYIVDKEADAFYDAWFQAQLEKPNRSGDSSLNPYFARKHTHVLKLSMIVAAAHRDELVIYKSDIEHALAILADTEKDMGHTFAGYGSNPLAFSQQAVEMMIMEAEENGIPYHVLLDTFRRDVSEEDLDRVLATLSKIGRIVRKPSLSGGTSYVHRTSMDEGAT